jgi:DNA-3-methyladenine glycosylase II
LQKNIIFAMVNFNKNNFKQYCDEMRGKHKIIAAIHAQFGYPPHWKRPATFDTLVKTILEQQVSLASAQSVYARLKTTVREVSPNEIIDFGKDNLGKCGITKQKQNYILGVAHLLLEQPKFLSQLSKLSDQEVYNALTSIKGFGPWSANVLMLVMLNRIDVYPEKDVALIKGISLAAFNAKTISNDEARSFIEKFSPMRSIAVCYFYWYYIGVKGVVFKV